MPNTISKEIRQSLNISWKEGIPAAITLGIMDYYLIPYGLFLGATTQEIGFLIAIPNLLASIAQLLAVRVVRFSGSRLRFLTKAVYLQAALLIPVAFLVFFFFQFRIALLICFNSLFKIIGNLIATAWGSLMSDYLPDTKRGHYMGWRSQVVGTASVIGIALAGLFLFSMSKIDRKLAFFLLFIFASGLRFSSCYLMSKMHNLPNHPIPGSDFTFIMFLRRFRESNFVKYVLYIASITFAVHLSSPYISVYMLRHLKFNYLIYMSVHLSAVAAGLISFPIWGKHADVVGNAKILKITSFLIPVIPLLWMLSKHPVFLMGAEMFSGFVWGGFNLCTANYIYDAVSPAKRVRCLGYFNLINGIALCAGASLGGFLAERLPPLWGYRLLSLFLLSAILRFLAHFLLSKRFKEVRTSAKHITSAQLFFSVLGIRPISELDREWAVFPLLHQIPETIRSSSPETK